MADAIRLRAQAMAAPYACAFFRFYTRVKEERRRRIADSRLARPYCPKGDRTRPDPNGGKAARGQGKKKAAPKGAADDSRESMD